jgi:arabinose-5-phosphate isomerase
MNNIKDYAIKCFQDEAQSILDLIPLLTDDFDNSIKLIHRCKGKLIITGVGKSGHCGAKMAATLASTGTPSFFINPLDAFHGDLGMIKSEDIVLAISNSGQTDELLRFIPYLIERKIPLIAMSGNPNSLLARYANYHLNIAVKYEACPLNLAPTSSTTATLAMGDAIACALMKIRHFQVSDYAQFHPGGNLGKRLLTRVKDVMYKESLPTVFHNMKVRDVFAEMSKAKLGIAVVIENEKIEGVITDGDIRRAMQSKENVFFELTVQDIMTTTPKTIIDSTILTDAESMMRKYNINSLIVVNEDNTFVGIIDTFRCTSF